eukprot:3460914-Alexandrium_andersonii.AAC.1
MGVFFPAKRLLQRASGGDCLPKDPPRPAGLSYLCLSLLSLPTLSHYAALKTCERRAGMRPGHGSTEE